MKSMGGNGGFLYRLGGGSLNSNNTRIWQRGTESYPKQEESTQKRLEEKMRRRPHVLSMYPNLLKSSPRKASSTKLNLATVNTHHRNWQEPPFPIDMLGSSAPGCPLYYRRRPDTNCPAGACVDDLHLPGKGSSFGRFTFCFISKKSSVP